MAGAYNLEMTRGVSFDCIIDYRDDYDNPVDLRGFEAMLQIRRQANTKAKLLCEASTSNGGITFPNIVNGEIQISIRSDQTILMDEGDWYYTLVVYQNRPHLNQQGEMVEYCKHVTTVMSGRVRVKRNTIYFSDGLCEPVNQPDPDPTPDPTDPLPDPTDPLPDDPLAPDPQL